MKNKRGFTLIEIIISIGILVLIGGVTAAITIVNNNKKELKTLKANALKFENALQVYLETNEEVIYNVNKNAKGAIITLDVLKNEGLIKDDLGIDYKKTYYLLSNAVLAPSGSNTDCDTGQVELAVVESWNVDTSNVIYICPNSGNSSDDLSARISALETSIIELNGTLNLYIDAESRKKTIFIGNDANNYVKFPVNSGNFDNNLLYFEEKADKNLWRIYDYYGIDGSSRSMKLVYNSNVKTKDRLSNVSMTAHSKNLIIKSNSSDYDFAKGTTSKTYYKIISGVPYKVNNCATKINDTKMTNIYKVGDDYYAASKTVSQSNEGVSYNVVDTKIDNWSATSVYCKVADSTNYYAYKYENAITYSELSNDNHFMDLYNKIQYRDWITDNTYYISYPGFTLNLNNSITRKVGVISSSEIIATRANDTSWLLNIMENKILGRVSESFDEGVGYLDSKFSLKGLQEKCDGIYCFESALEYVPAITLKQGVKFIKDTSCSSMYTPGSKSCPYLLEYNGITT